MKKKIALFLSKLFIIFYKLRYGRRVQFGKNIIINHRFKIQGKGKLMIGDNCTLWAHEEPNRFHFYEETARIKIGSGNRLNGMTAHCAESIEIGNDNRIASTILMDTDFHTFEDPEHILYGNPKTKPIKIGNGTWICGQSVILKGCEIGDGSVIGFRAVVTKNVPTQVVVAGNPAKVVKEKK